MKVMKHNILITGLFALSSIIVASCAREQLTDDSDNKPEHKSGQVVSIFATTQPVKTANDGLDTKWTADDALNVFHAEAGEAEYGSNDKFTIDPENIETGRFLGTLTTPLEAEKSYDWYVLYPYNKNIQTPANSSKGYLPIGSSGKSVAQVQEGNNSTAHLCGQYFPLYGKALNVAKGESPVITMNQALCVVKVHVTNNSTEPLTVETVSFEANEDITGTYFINFAGDAPVFKSSGGNYVSNIVNLTVNGGEEIAVGGEADFYLAVKPFTAAMGTSLEVAVNGVTKTVSIPEAKDVEFKPGTIKKISYSYAPPAPVSYTLVTSLNDIEEGDYIITNGNYALQNTFSSSAPAVALSSSFGTIADNVFTTSSTQCVWTFTGDNKSMTIRPYGSDTDYLYATSDNNGLRAGDTSDTWCFETNNGVTNGFSMKEAKNSRYCAVYVDKDGNPTDWRTYTSAQHTNYKLNKGALLLYKAASTAPKIIPGDDIVAPATGVTDGTLTYTVKNFDDDVTPSVDGCVTAATINTKGTVTYTVAPNYTLNDAEGTITLTSASTGATATVAVSQDASVFEVTADDPVVIGNKAEDEGTFTIKSTFGGNLAISDSWNFIINETYEANEEGTTVTIVAVNDGAATDREATITVTRKGQENVVVNILQNKQGAQPLNVPENIVATGKSVSGISAEWTGDDNADSYDWIISTETTAEAAESDPNKKSGNVTEEKFSCTDSFDYGTYYIYVRSVGDGVDFTTSGYGKSDAVVIDPVHTLTIDFENTAKAYKLWTFENIVSQKNVITAHSGSYCGNTDGKNTGSVTTKQKVSSPKNLTCYISKESNNTSSSNWKIQVSSDGESWTDAATKSATGMNKGVWQDFSCDLSSYKDVYVRVYYDGTSAIRDIDDLVLTYEGSEIKDPELTSIAVKTSSHRNFTQGDDFVKETIEATYSNSSTSDVTEAASFSGYDMSTVGEQTVTVTYAEGGIEKSVTYTINVTAGGGEEVSGVLASWTFTSGTAGTNYPSNKVDFANNGSDDLASGTFYLNGTGSTWNTGKGYAFTAVTDITITVKAKKTLKKGAKITFSMDTFYNKASNAPMKGFSLTAAEGSATASTTGLSATSFSLSDTKANKSVEYTLQNDVVKDGTVKLVLTGTGKAGSGQGFISNIIAEYTAN